MLGGWTGGAMDEGAHVGASCPTCRGKGSLTESPDWCGIEPGGSMRCPTCRGTGTVAPIPSAPAQRAKVPVSVP